MADLQEIGRSDSEAASASGSGSTTPNSTSTYEYSHEPFETFQNKVMALAREIGGCHDVSLQRQRGGSYNRVVIAVLSKRGQNVRGIFRIPRFTDVTGPAEDESSDQDGREDEGQETARKEPRVDEEVQDQAAVLQLLASRKIAAPALLAFDACAENPLKAPYVFQECSTGTPLDKVYGNMSLKEKLCIVDELVQTLVAAEKVTFAQSGTIVAGHRESASTAASYVFGKEGTTLATAVKQFSDTVATSLTHLLSAKIQEHLEKARQFDVAGTITKMWQRLEAILEEMQQKGIFALQCKAAADVNHSILYHWDLEPRNILVKKNGEKWKWVIDMVIDWDRVLAVPPVLARKPPVWLWDFSDDSDRASIASDYDGDVDLLNPSRYVADNGRLAADDVEIMRAFEHGFVERMKVVYEDYSREAYQEEAYGKGRWIRRIARFAIHGASDSQDLTRFEHLDNDWSACFYGGDSESRESQDEKND